MNQDHENGGKIQDYNQTRAKPRGNTHTQAHVQPPNKTERQGSPKCPALGTYEEHARVISQR